MSSTSIFQRPAVPSRGGGSVSAIYIAFVPWVLFTLVIRRGSFLAAAVVALAAAVLICLRSLSKGHPRLLELAAVLAFAGFTTVAVVADPSISAGVARYARAVAAAGLALTAFGSLLFVPFTEQYARESVPRRFWVSPTFRLINRHLTAMWGWVFVAMIPSHLIAGAMNTHRANMIFNWVIPIVLIVWAAKRTAAVTSTVKGA